MVISLSPPTPDSGTVPVDFCRAGELVRRSIPPDGVIAGLDVGVSFEPRWLVGGDTVDVRPTRDGRTLAVVADVSGHGLESALVAAAVRSQIHARLQLAGSLTDLVEHLNAYLCEFLVDDLYVTLVCVAVDPRDGGLEYVNAGHPPPIVVGASGGVRFLDGAGSQPLGIEAMPLQSGFDRIGRDDVLGIFTDGWTELMNEADQQLGLTRIGGRLAAIYTARPAAAASELAGRLARQLDRFNGNHLRTDDRSFLLARRAWGNSQQPTFSHQPSEC